MADKEHFWEEQLTNLKGRIEAIREAARQKGPDVLDRYAGDLERLLEKYDAARYKFTLLRKGSGDALTELRAGFERALTDLKSAVTRAKNKF